MSDLQRENQERIRTKSWEIKIALALKGKIITNVRYLTKKEMEGFGWYRKALVIILNDGTCLFPSADDEGNDAGALFTNIKGLEIIPVI